jgi:hypothetical protein
VSVDRYVEAEGRVPDFAGRVGCASGNVIDIDATGLVAAVDSIDCAGGKDRRGYVPVAYRSS